MKENLTELIRESQKGNQECLLLIIEKLKPAIHKYARRLSYHDFEDTVAELELAVLESVKKIPSIKNEAQCLAFLIKAIEHKHWELIRKRCKVSGAEVLMDEQCPDCPYWEYGYGNCELMLDVGKLLSKCSARQREILLAIIFEGKTSSLVAAELHTTRQYVNRVKNKWLEQIKKEIYTEEAM